MEAKELGRRRRRGPRRPGFSGLSYDEYAAGAAELVVAMVPAEGGPNQIHPSAGVACFAGMREPIVGREGELAVVTRVLDDAANGPAGLLVEGVAGIGKTTLWHAAVDAAVADGRRVLVARGAGAEVRLAYAGLADLLADVGDEVLDRLPAPQRDALNAALLRGAVRGEAGPDPRAVATGLTSTLELLAAERPVLVAVDDLQWLDGSTADALRFAMRRVAGPIGVLAVRRLGEAIASDADLPLRDAGRLTRLPVAPLTAQAIEQIVADGAGRPVSGSLMARIADVAGGNPFIALELARTLDDDALAAPTALPASLREIVDARLSLVDGEAREVVLYAAMLTRPDVPRVQQAIGDRDAVALLGHAEDAGILTLDGAQVRFAHPLLATGVYSALSSPKRRAAHRVIAQVTEGEEQARHLALAAVSAEPAVVDALDRAAAGARARGSAAAAAELLELALRLGADAPERRQRAAQHHLDAGEMTRARELFEGLVEELPPGPRRAPALGGMGTIHRLADDMPTGVAFIEQAMEEADDEAQLVMLALELAFARTQAGRVLEAVPLAETAIVRAERIGDPGLLAQALAVGVMVGFLVGRGADEETLARALQLEDDRGGPAMLRPSLIAGLIWLWSGRLEEAHVAISRALQHSRDRGEESDLVIVTIHSGTLACLRGDVASGRQMVDDSLRRAERLGSPTSRAVARENEAVVAGWAGDVETARAAGREAIELYESIGSPVGTMYAHAALGLLELALGEYAVAADHLLPAANVAVGMGAGDPGALHWGSDAVEALAAVDRLDEAEEIRAWHRWRSDAIGRPALLAVAARLDGIVLAGRGRLAEAEAALDAALVHHERHRVDYELARTLLVLGQVRRRRRRRAAARASFEAAREAFAALGAVIWTERANAELQRVVFAGASDGELTPGEQRVAQLAAAGLTNRAAAAELFVSPKTVEAMLSRVYRKLGIRSRAELGRWVAEHPLVAEAES